MNQTVNKDLENKVTILQKKNGLLITQNFTKEREREREEKEKGGAGVRGRLKPKEREMERETELGRRCENYCIVQI